MVRIINNNLWSPVPWGWGCGMQQNHCCHNNGNNWMNNMFKYQFMFQMMNNMQNMFRCYATPPQQSGMYPYVNFSTEGAGGANTGGSYADQLSQNNSLKGISDTYGKYFNISKIGDKYYAVSKDCKTQISGETPEELLENIGQYIEANPDVIKGSKKSEKSDVGELKVDYGDKPESPSDTTPSDGTPADETPAEPAGKTPAGGRKSPKGWYPASQQADIGINSKEAINKNRGKNTTPAVYVAQKVIESKGSKFSWVDPNKLGMLIRKNNPSVFKSDGQFVDNPDFDKLDIPTAATLNSLRKDLEKDIKKDVACNNPNSKIAKWESKATKWNDGSTGAEKHQLTWTDKNYITSTDKHGEGKTSGIADSDAILVINDKQYNIHSGSNTADFYSLTGNSSCGTNNYKLINNKGHFDPNNEYRYYLTDLSGNQTGHAIQSEKHNGKNYFVLICGKNRFSMDDIMAGNVPWDKVNGNEDNKYALWRS